MKKRLMQENLVGNSIKKQDIKYIQILSVPTEGATENIGEGFRN